MSKHFTAEEVARMVGGEAVVVNGRKAIKLPDGRILQKHQAFIKAMLTGWISPHTRVHLPKWLRELSRTYYTLPIPLERLAKQLVKVYRTVRRR